MGDPGPRVSTAAMSRRRVSKAARRWLPVAIALLFAAQLVGPLRGEPSVVAYPDRAAVERTETAAVYGSDRISCPGLTLGTGTGNADLSASGLIDSIVVSIPEGCRARWLQLTALDGGVTVSRGSVMVRPGSGKVTVRMTPAIDPRRGLWWSVSSEASY